VLFRSSDQAGSLFISMLGHYTGISLNPPVARSMKMTFIRTIPEAEADGLLLDLYQAAKKTNGYVPNYAQALSLHPEVYEAWTKLIAAVRGKMRMRRYELVTFAAAMTLECTYCMLAHGAILVKNFFTSKELIAIVHDFHNAGLPPEEVAIMEFAQKITRMAHDVNEGDMTHLRSFGLSDEEILDITLACTARNFLSKTLDALDVPPDAAYMELDPELRQMLALGRPFSVA
jgi:uncharacterized peroxidase-related enzyme